MGERFSMPESIEQSVNTVLALLPENGEEVTYRDFHAQALAATPNAREAIISLKSRNQIVTRLIVLEDGTVGHFVKRGQS